MHKHRRHFPSLVSLLLSSLCFSNALSLSLCLHHVHGVLCKKGVDIGKGWAELAVSVPAAQHELVETLRTHSRPAQIHLQEREINFGDLQIKASHKVVLRIVLVY